MSQFITFTVYFSLVCIMFLLTLFADRGALKWTDQDEKTEKIPLVNRDHNNGCKMEDDSMTCRSVDFNDKVNVLPLFS